MTALAAELAFGPEGGPTTRPYVAETRDVIGAVIKTAASEPETYDLSVQLYTMRGEPQGNRLTVASGVALPVHARDPFIASSGGQFFVGWFVDVGPERGLRFRWVSLSGAIGGEGSLAVWPDPDALWSLAHRDDGVAISWVGRTKPPAPEILRAVVAPGATDATVTTVATSELSLGELTEASAPDGGAWLAYSESRGPQFVLLRLDAKGNVVSRATRPNRFGKSLAVTSDAAGPILAWWEYPLAEGLPVSIVRPDDAGRIDGPPIQQPIGAGAPGASLGPVSSITNAHYLFGRHLFTPGRDGPPREVVPEHDWAQVLIPFQGSAAVVSFAHPSSGREIHVLPTRCLR